MSMSFQDFLRLPGPEAVISTAETNLLWNKGQLAVFDYGSIISGSATDAGNTPTTTLRGGLLLGKKTADGKLYAWSATATDGTQNPYGFLVADLNLLDINASGQDRVWATLVGGWVKNAAVFSAAGALTAQMRQQLRGRFWFDDDFSSAPGNYYPFRQQISKTANYTVLASDNGGLFDNTGATGAVTFTLPAIAPGLYYSFFVAADQNVTVSSNEGGNIVTLGNATASHVAFTTAGSRLGAMLRMWTNPAGSLWYTAFNSPQPATIS